MFIFLALLFICAGIVFSDDENDEESGSGQDGDFYSESASGMLGDEIMPVSSMDSFDQQPYDEEPADNSPVQKRGNINRADRSSKESTAKRAWNHLYPFFHWLQAQQQSPPMQHNQPAGRCLEENSLCDIGHDEQCCGHATYCVDYWGVGKCLAFLRPDKYDSTIATRINRNNLYKAYYRKMEYAAKIKG